MDDYEIPSKIEGVYFPNKYSMSKNTNVMSALPYDNYTKNQPQEYNENRNDEYYDEKPFKRHDDYEYAGRNKYADRHENIRWKTKDAVIPITPEDAQIINVSKIGNLKKDIQRENFTPNASAANFTISNSLGQLNDNVIMFIVIITLICYLIYVIKELKMELQMMKTTMMINWPKNATV